MKNAEKLAKDTDFLADAISGYDCSENDCSNCPMIEFHGHCFDKERVKEWLEDEAKEDDRS